MAYRTDERDIHFNLFEYIKIGDLTSYDKFKDHSEDMYRMVVNEGLKFCTNELDPLYVSGDRESCQMKDGKVITPKGFRGAFKKMAENGFLSIDAPLTYGGQGLPVTINSVMNEFFTGSNICLALYAGLTRGAALDIETFGDEKLAKMFCEKLYNGTWAGTMCLTEAGAGSAVGDLKTSAKPNADGSYSITGSKLFISGGDHDMTDNIIHLLLARVEGDAPGTKGISLFVVPKIWVNPDGSLGDSNDVNCVNIEHKMGIKASATCTLNFGENGKCRGFLIGERSMGIKYMFKMMNEARLLCGMQGLGLGSTAYLNALQYTKERVQGGQTLIIDYPDVRRNLALCKAWVEGMRALMYKTGLHIDLAEVHSDEAKRDYHKNRADLYTPICKAYCSDVGFKVTETAIQIYGGYGYCSEYPVEQYLRDVKIASIYEGTNGIQAMDLMGRKLAMKNGQLFREFYEELTQFAAKNESNEALKDAFASFKKATDTVAQVAMKIAEWGMGGDQIKPLSSATAFLEMVGHTTLAFVLLEQAVIAQNQIKAGKGDVFYKNKIRTAKFFVNHILPGVQMRAKEILSEDLSAMEMEY